MGEKNLTDFMKKLSAQIKYNEVSQASWGGTKSFKPKLSTSSSNVNPSLDFLLNSASKLDREQKNKNQMLEEYRQKQEQPVIKYDEFGNTIIGDDGKPISFKFHNIPSPEIDISPIVFRYTNPMGRMDEIRIPYNEIQNQTKAGIISQFLGPFKDLEVEIINLIKEAEVDLKELNKLLNELEKRHDDLTDKSIINFQNLQFNTDNDVEFGDEGELYGPVARPAINPDMLRRYIDSNQDEIDQVKEFIRVKNEEIEFLKHNMEVSLENRQDLSDEAEVLIAQVENRKKENKLKLDAYYSELQNINSGKFNAEKMFDETDEQYLERLERLADTPKDNNINFDLAKMDQKKTLRENLKELVRDDQIINQVVNELNPELVFEFNKIFEIFKTIFLKKYGYDNKNIKYQDIITEFVNYMRARENQQLVLRGNYPTASEASETIDFTDNPVLESSSSSSSSSSSQKKGAYIIPKLLDNNETLSLTSGFNDITIYLRYKIDPKYLRPAKEEPQSGAKKAGRPAGEYEKLPSGTYFLFSFTNDQGDFRQVPSFSKKNNIYDIISDHLEIPKENILNFFGLNPLANIVQGIGKARFEEKLVQMGLKPSLKTGYIAGKEGKRFIIGEGLSHEKKDKKVKFGDVVIMPNKLFYDNILSISRPDGVKINGFKNRHVSDDFVVLIVKMLEHRNDYQRELNNLSSSERVLLDNLLSLANLHKKVITGSGNDSINKLKNELQILEGQIQAGNNNESLKKKLHDILYKLAHFKVISLTQANKHYKDYINNFF